MEQLTEAPKGAFFVSTARQRHPTAGRVPWFRAHRIRRTAVRQVNTRFEMFTGNRTYKAVVVSTKMFCFARLPAAPAVTRMESHPNHGTGADFACRWRAVERV